MMPSVTIDAGVLAAPPMEATTDEVVGYVKTLLDWKELLDLPWVAIYMSERATDVLFDEEVYPLRDALKCLFESKGINQYDVNTVAQVTEPLLRLTPHFETHFRVHDILVEDPFTEPNLLSIHTSQSLVSDLARCVLLIAILRNHCRTPARNHSLIVKPWQGGTLVQVRAIIHDLDHQRDDILELPKPPAYFHGSVLVCQNFREFILAIDEVTIWDTACDETGMQLAIQIALYKSRLQRDLEPEWEAVPAYSFGRAMCDTTRECCRAGPRNLIEKILRAIVETLDKRSLRAVHELRTAKSGNAPQRMRGKDKAWRRDIDNEYHLHYWECSNGIVEFASVVLHNDFSIPE